MRTPSHRAAADVGAADLVGHAGEGDVALDHRHGEQLGVGDLVRAVDLAVDGELPAVGGHAGDHQGGVDPVELRVRRAERGDAAHRVPRGPPRAGSSGSAAAGRATDDGDAPRERTLAQGAAGRRRPHRAPPRRRARAGGRCGRPRRPCGPRRRRRPGRASRCPQRSRRPRNQPAARTPTRAVTIPGSRSTKVLVGRSAAATAELIARAASSASPMLRRVRATRPMRPGEEQRAEGDRADEDRLVGRAELRHRPLLDGCGREVDDRRPDREHRGGLGGDEPGDEVTDAGAGGRGQDGASRRTSPVADVAPGAVARRVVVMPVVRSGAASRMGSPPQCARGRRGVGPAAHVP